MLWSFAKYAGCGNDFAFFDNRKTLFPTHNSALIQRLCHRQWGIGADGVILLELSACADFRMRIFNADGLEAEMCGNGIRCLLRFIQELGFNQSSYQIETMKRVLKISQQGVQVSVEMGEPLRLQWNIHLPFNDQTYQVHYLDTGVPHIVLFVEDVEMTNFRQLGPYIRYHPLFSPTGTNVNLAQKLSNQEIKVRTYERGVEGETLACGTGATAVALAAAFQYGLKSPIRIQTCSQDILEIGFLLQDQIFSQVTMTGPTQYIYRGEIKILGEQDERSFSIDLK